MLAGSLASAATFSIDAIHIHEQLTPGQDGIVIPQGANIQMRDRMSSIPQVEADVRVSQDAQSKNLLARAYFFDEAGKLMQKCTGPALAQHFTTEAGRGVVRSYSLPAVLAANSRQAIFFPLPVNFTSGDSIIVVFGNVNGAVAAAVPDDSEQTLDFPEKQLVARTQLAPDVALVDTGSAPAPLIEQQVESDNPRYPAFTLLLHLPHGVNSPKEVRGVLAICMLANSVGQIRDALNAIKPIHDPNPYFAFAESHQLAIVAWGARWVWNSYALAQKAMRDAANQKDITQSQEIDLTGFNAAPFYGDLMNQIVFTARERNMIPADFLVPLPNKEIADAWNR